MIDIFQGQTPLDVCDGVTYDLLKEIKAQRPPVKVMIHLQRYFASKYSL